METIVNDLHGDPINVRVDFDGEIVVEPASGVDEFYFDLDGAKQLRDVLDKAIAEVEGRAK